MKTPPMGFHPLYSPPFGIRKVSMTHQPDKTSTSGYDILNLVAFQTTIRNKKEMYRSFVSIHRLPNTGYQILNTKYRIPM